MRFLKPGISLCAVIILIAVAVDDGEIRDVAELGKLPELFSHELSDHNL